MQLHEFIKKTKVFTIEEARQALYKDSAEKRTSTLNNLLNYHLRQGHIARVYKGLYYTISRDWDSIRLVADPILLLMKMAPDAFLGYQTAMDYYGHLYSLRCDHVYVTQYDPTPYFVFNHSSYQGVKMPKRIALKDPYFGVETVMHDDVPIRVTSIERTFVDVLDRPELMGSWEEVWRAIDNIDKVDFDAIFEYTRMLGNATTAAKVGFFLEDCRKILGTEEKHLALFDPLKPKKIHYISRYNQGPRRLVKRWNLIIPESLLDKTWDEFSQYSGAYE